MVKLLPIKAWVEEWAETNYRVVRTRITEMMVGVRDKGGNPYVDHLAYVSSRQGTHAGRIIALLHDLIEDDHVTEKQLLKDWGVPEAIVERVVLLSKPRHQSYEDYISALCFDHDTRQVKKADLEHNMEIGRLYRNGPLTEKDVARLNKYLKARLYIAEREKDMGYN